MERNENIPRGVAAAAAVVVAKVKRKGIGKGTRRGHAAKDMAKAKARRRVVIRRKGQVIPEEIGIPMDRITTTDREAAIVTFGVHMEDTVDMVEGTDTEEHGIIYKCLNCFMKSYTIFDL